MENINNLLEKITINNKKVSIDDIMSLCLNETEYEILIKELKKRDVKIEQEKEETDELDLSYYSDDSTALYLKEITRIPLLKAEEEKALFEQYRETKDLNIRKRIADANLRLVVSVAKQYSSVSKTTTMGFLDLVQEGNEGLLKAIEKFDVTLGYRFSTYATWWIRQGITRSIADYGRTIRIPVHTLEIYRKFKKYEEREIKLNNEIPSKAQIAEYFNMSEKYVGYIMDLCDSIVLSLEDKISEEQDSERGEFIESNDPTVEELVDRELTKELINKIMRNSLTPREAIVVSMRYGIMNEFNDSNAERTLEEVGKILGVTRERIRQIECKALRKIRKMIERTEKRTYAKQYK